MHKDKRRYWRLPIRTYWGSPTEQDKRNVITRIRGGEFDTHLGPLERAVAYRRNVTRDRGYREDDER